MSFRDFPRGSRAIQAALDFINPRLNGETASARSFPPWPTPSWPSTPSAIPATIRATCKPSGRSAGYSSRHAMCEPGGRATASLVLRRSGTPRSPPTPFSRRGLTPPTRGSSSACDWLAARQILEVKGDWAMQASPSSNRAAGPSNISNDYYPDVDDTAVVGMLLHRVDARRYGNHIARAARWIEGMQSTNGGWGAFDIDNNADFLNSIPFADHGALLDPPTVDVTARCISFLCQIGYPQSHAGIAGAASRSFDAEQEEDGSWFGRWGTNYVYGTWSALMRPQRRRRGHATRPGCAALSTGSWRGKTRDGGWGEDGGHLLEGRTSRRVASSPSQTAWARSRA